MQSGWPSSGEHELLGMVVGGAGAVVEVVVVVVDVVVGATDVVVIRGGGTLTSSPSSSLVTFCRARKMMTAMAIRASTTPRTTSGLRFHARPSSCSASSAKGRAA